VLTLIVLAIISTVSFADNKNGRTYDQPFDKVWSACVQTAGEKYFVTHSEKESGILTFRKSPGFTTNAEDVSVQVIKITDTQTEVTAHAHQIGTVFQMNGGFINKFFKAIDEKLK
jgi:hypothetical protein